MLGNMLNDLAEAIRRWTEKNAFVHLYAACCSPNKQLVTAVWALNSKRCPLWPELHTVDAGTPLLRQYQNLHLPSHSLRRFGAAKLIRKPVFLRRFEPCMQACTTCQIKLLGTSVISQNTNFNTDVHNFATEFIELVRLPHTSSIHPVWTREPLRVCHGSQGGRTPFALAMCSA